MHFHSMMYCENVLTKIYFVLSQYDIYIGTVPLSGNFWFQKYNRNMLSGSDYQYINIKMPHLFKVSFFMDMILKMKSMK